MIFEEVTVTSSVPEACVHPLERVYTDEELTSVTGMLDLVGVVLPVRPLTVSTGAHQENNGTLKVRETVIVLESQGNGELCNTLHMLL